MRVTKKTIIKWLNEKSTEMGESFKATDVTIYTGLSQSQREGGCNRFVVHVSSGDNICYIPCTYTMGDLQDHINAGYKLILKLDHFGVLHLSEIDLVKA